MRSTPVLWAMAMVSVKSGGQDWIVLGQRGVRPLAEAGDAAARRPESAGNLHRLVEQWHCGGDVAGPVQGIAELGERVGDPERHVRRTQQWQRRGVGGGRPCCVA